MAKAKREQDEISAAGIAEIELARPVKDASGKITGYDRAFIPKSAWEAQQQLADEDKDPRYLELKQVSDVEKQLVENQKPQAYQVNKAVNEPNAEVEALRKELAELKALVSQSSKPKKGE